MKTMGILSLIFGMSIHSHDSAAIGRDGDFSEDVHYESWCENDSVKAADDDGHIYTVTDCYDGDEQLACVEISKKVGTGTLVYATCK